jgi:3-deoxy-manno-octulosonate cytidylyltransferase (CMP-KDO synthetase)
VTAVARAVAALADDGAVGVATDDARIVDHARQIGADAVMTASDLDSGSLRACAAARAWSQRPGLVINLQGDAPFISPPLSPG